LQQARPNPLATASRPHERVTTSLPYTRISATVIDETQLAPLRHNLTYDQGKEMTRHRDPTCATHVQVYFCDPHSPWQRGTCENTNGLIRQLV
jgi:IS30 family transposase